MEKYFKPKRIRSEESPSTPIGIETSPCTPIVTEIADNHGGFNTNEIVYDPGLRKSINEFDVAIRDQIRRELVAKGPCQPIGHKYPKTKFGKQERSFQDGWYEKFPWLEYSMSKDAAFCFWCYLFKPSSNRGGQFDDDAFVRKGFSNWKKALERFHIHSGAVDSAHNEARVQLDLFKNQKNSLMNIVQENRVERQIAYRIRLTLMLDVTRLLLKQGLSFRGHDESSSSLNKGNFRELVDWYCARDEDICKAVKKDAAANNLMDSPKIQKQLAKACAEEITHTILTDIGDGVFALLVDESRDVSVKEQMGVVLRYVNKEGRVLERFFAIRRVPDTTSSSLKESIEELFSDHRLSLSRLRGQGYDGASNMRGEFNGLKALMLKDYPSAIYVHCFSHQLQLVLIAVAKNISDVGDFFAYVTMIVNMVGASCKRREQIREKEQERIRVALEGGYLASGKGKNQETNLARPGDTRWGSHYLTIVRLHLMWPSVIEVLGEIHDHGIISDQRGLATSLIDKMESYQFVFVLHLMKHLLGITNELSLVLQKKDQNIVNALVLIKSVKRRLQEFMTIGWEIILNEVNIFCELHKISVLDMTENRSTRGYGMRRGQVVTNYHHFRFDVLNEVVNLMLQEMNDRFSEGSTILLSCISCLDPRNSFSQFDVDKLVELASFYPEDFSPTDCACLKQQLCNYVYSVRLDARFSEIEDLGNLALKLVETENHKVFPLVYRLIELALVLPVATASVERVFSAMKIVKTDLRNKMDDEFMNDSLVVYIEKGIFATIQNEAILQRFQDMTSRRTQLPSLPRAN